MCRLFCGHKFSPLWVNIKECDAGMYDKSTFRQPHCIAKWLHHFALRPARMSIPVAPHPHQHLVPSVVWVWAIRIRCVLVSHRSFNLHFPDDIGYAVSFPYAYLPSVSITEGVSVKVFGSFEKPGCLFPYCWVLGALCIFWRTILYQACLAQTCFPGVWLIF